MKNFTLFFFIVFSSFKLYSQCTPDVSCVSTSYGTCPDTIVNLPNAMVNHLYNEKISIKIPANGADWGYALLTITKLEIYKDGNTGTSDDGFINFPTEFNYACNGNNGNCSWLAGTNGCINISGIPITEGAFKFNIVFKVYANGGALSLLDTVYGYKINVLNDTTQITGTNFNHSIQGFFLNISPNPIKNNLKLTFNNISDGEVEIKIIDIVGVELFKEKNYFSKGTQTLTLSKNNLNILSGGLFYIAINTKENRLVKPIIFD